MGFYTRTKQPIVGNIADALGFDEETNTLEVGGNLYVDGEIISGEPTNIFNLLNITAQSPFRDYNYHTPYNNSQVIETLLKYNFNGFVVSDSKEIGKIVYIDSTTTINPTLKRVVVRALNGSWELTYYGNNPVSSTANNIYYGLPPTPPQPFKSFKYKHTISTTTITIAGETLTTLDVITDFEDKITTATMVKLYERGELLLRAITSTGDTFTLFPFIDKEGPTGTEYTVYKAFYIGLDNSVNIVNIATGTFIVNSDTVSEIL